MAAAAASDPAASRSSHLQASGDLCATVVAPARKADGEIDVSAALVRCVPGGAFGLEAGQRREPGHAVTARPVLLEPSVPFLPFEPRQRPFLPA